MLKNNINYIIAGLLIVLIVKVFVFNGSQNDLEQEIYREKISDLQRENAKLTQINKVYEKDINNLYTQYDSIKNSIIIDTATISDLNNLFADYLTNRHE